MKDMVPEVKKGFLLDECDDLSRDGLRTLVFGYKILKPEYYESWKRIYEEAGLNIKNRD